MILRRIKNKLSSIVPRPASKQAFTLVEIIVILFIISVGLLGVLSLVIQNIKSQIINKNNIIAYQLAQEGIELVRKTRDTNWLNKDPWNQNLADGFYYMDYLDTAPQTLTSDDTLDDLYLDNTTGFYIHSSVGSTATNFSRIISLETTGDMMTVVSQVAWKDRNNTFNYNLETVLYDWFQKN